MANNRFNFPFSQVFQATTGDVGAGWKLYFYASGSSSTLQDTYSDTALTTPNANPVVADASGRFGAIFLSPLNYNVVLKDANDATIASADPVSSTDEPGAVYAANYATLALAVAAAQGRELVISENTVVSANTTVSGCSVRFVYPGNIDPNAGVTVTYSPTSHTGCFNCFDKTALGTFSGTFGGGPLYASDFGATGDGSTDDTDAIQNLLDVIRDSAQGMASRFRSTKYRIDGRLTLLADVEMDHKTWVLDFNGATLDWSNTALTTGYAFNVGAESNNFTYRELSFIKLLNLRMIGPETQNCYTSGGPAFPTADTSLVGLALTSALNITLDNVFIRRFYKGLYAERCWPITANAVVCNGNYIAFQLGSYCTLGTWTSCSAEAAAYCLVLQPDQDEDIVDSQTFIGMRFENSLRGITLDQRGSGSGTANQIRDINIIAPRFEGIAYDLLRMGQAFEYANASIAGADRATAYCQSVRVIGGEWQDSVVSGYSVRSSANGYVRGCDLNIPIGDYSLITGTLALSRVHIMPGVEGGTDSGMTRYPEGAPVVFGDAIEFNTNSGGIDFSGITSTSSGVTGSRVIDDFETGTWTPTYAPETGAFGSVTYDAITTGNYVKIGTLVFVRGTIRTDAITVGTAADGVRIGGLPYTPAAATFPISISNAEAFAGDYPNGGFVRSGAALISLLYRTAVNGATSNLQVADLDVGANTNEVTFSAIYTTGI